LISIAYKLNLTKIFLKIWFYLQLISDPSI
jgi:hypothetical protein